MTTITTIKCDGCDKIQGPKEDFTMGVEVKVTARNIPPAQDTKLGPFDLCSGCFIHLEGQCNPSKWARIIERAPRVE